MLAVNSKKYPWGNIRMPINNYTFNNTIHLVRNPFDAIPSIILENKYSKRSYNFRKKNIKDILNIDLPLYTNSGNLLYDTELAIKTYIYWNKICELNNPTYTVKLEEAYILLTQFNINKIQEETLNKTYNNSENKRFNGKRYNKPIVDFHAISDDLKNILNIFCEKYDYPKIHN
jgi:hypothetical protein